MISLFDVFNYFMMLNHYVMIIYCYVSIYNFLTPVFGALLSAILIPEESLNLLIIVAIALVAVGIIIMNYNDQAKDSIESLSKSKAS